MIDVYRLRTLIQYYSSLGAGGVSAGNEKQILASLKNTLPFFTHLTKAAIFGDLYRITVNKRIFGGKNKRINDIMLLKYPPAEKVTKYGRCNMPGQSVLYASFIELISLGEIRPERGDLITRSHWKVRENQGLKYCPIFKNQPKKTLNHNMWNINQEYEEFMKSYPKHVKAAADLIMQFVADNFTKKVPSDNHLEYIFSAFFSDIILNELESGTIEAIYYPSVKNKLSFENLAIKPAAFDLKYELHSVSESIVLTDLSDGQGGIGSQGTCQCYKRDFDGDKILWENHPTFYPKWIDINDPEHGYDFSSPLDQV